MNVYAQIGFSGMHVGMSKCSRNNRQRYPLLQHGAGKAMTKSVHSRRLTNGPFDSGFLQIFLHCPVHGRGEDVIRRAMLDKYMIALTFRPSVLQIIDDRPTDSIGQRQFNQLPGFLLNNR